MLRAFASPHDLGVDASAIPSFLHSCGALFHPAAHHGDPHFPATLLSDSSAAAAAHPPPVSGDTGTNLNMGEIFREVEDEVKREINGQERVVVTPEMAKASLNDVGHDLILFLARFHDINTTASSIIPPLTRAELGTVGRRAS